MPELPEVEVVRRGLAGHVVGRDISAADFYGARVARRHPGGGRDLRDRLSGARVAGAHRRGKYLWLRLANPAGDAEALVIHLGMSGQLLVEDAAAADEKHLRARFAFADGGHELRFVDQRTFGGMHLSDVDDAGVPESVAHIARDPLDTAFDPSAVVEKIRSRPTQIKRQLLDQSLVSGIGNIYADEALWLVGLHGRTPGSALTPAQGTALLGAAADVMAAALDAGGTSFDSLYVNVNGASGYFERSLNAYGREGKECRRCGTPMRREAFMNRSSYYCPDCQVAP